ncbi:MAG: hypothetical protein RBS57_08265 [Desulforhabdus sp.]|nr:hypothetical protein [Desulforhabdus sp.]
MDNRILDRMGFPCRWVYAIVAVCMLASCAPTRTVYIPPEWQQPSTQAGAPARTRQQPEQDASRPPVMKPAPQIREMEVSQAPQEGTSESGSQQFVANPDRASDPQYLASMHLVDQGQASLAQGNADGAIALLEQAIQVDVYNAEAFLGLARAWRIKGSQSKSLEFANKAEMLFQDNPKKLKQVYLMKAELFKELNDAAKTDYYLQKAARLN